MYPQRLRLGIVALAILTAPLAHPSAGASDSRTRLPARGATEASIGISTTKTIPAPARLKLPPPPDGVIHLELEGIFRNPVGPRGLEFTEKATSLDGKKVRLSGFRAQEMEARRDVH